MAKVIKMTEQDLVKLVKRVLQEQTTQGVLPSAVNTVLDIAGQAKDTVFGTAPSEQKFGKLISLCRGSKNVGVGNNQKADMIRNAIQGMGTDETMVFKAFGSLGSFDEFCSVAKAYKDSYGVDLYNELKGDFERESEWAQLMRPIRDLLARAKGSSPTGGGPAPVVAKKKGQGPAGATSIPQKPAVRPTTTKPAVAPQRPAVAQQRPAVRQTGIDLQSKNRNMPPR